MRVQKYGKFFICHYFSPSFFRVRFLKRVVYFIKNETFLLFSILVWGFVCTFVCKTEQFIEM